MTSSPSSSSSINTLVTHHNNVGNYFNFICMKHTLTMLTLLKTFFFRWRYKNFFIHDHQQQLHHHQQKTFSSIIIINNNFIIINNFQKLFHPSSSTTTSSSSLPSTNLLTGRPHHMVNTIIIGQSIRTMLIQTRRLTDTPRRVVHKHTITLCNRTHRSPSIPGTPVISIRHVRRCHTTMRRSLKMSHKLYIT